jgi:hypothetical protein
MYHMHVPHAAQWRGGGAAPPLLLAAGACTLLHAPNAALSVVAARALDPRTAWPHADHIAPG